MNSYKAILYSTTFWGAVVSLASTLVPKFFTIIGLDPGPTGQATLVKDIVLAIGFVVTVYGRLTATQLVSFSGKPPAGK